jgi:hypothetical protein
VTAEVWFEVAYVDRKKVSRVEANHYLDARWNLEKRAKRNENKYIFSNELQEVVAPCDLGLGFDVSIQNSDSKLCLS